MAKPPVAVKRPQARIHHGDEFLDDFEWLRDKESREVLQHLEAENSYTDEMTAHLAQLRKTIFDEIKSRTQETDMSVPVRMKDWWYYSRIEEGEQYARHCRVAATADWTPPLVEPGQPIAGEDVLLDSNVEAQGHDFYSLGGFDVTNDGKWLAYSVDTVGDERYTIRVKNLSDGTLLDDQVTEAAGGITWSKDGNYFFFVRYDDAWRPYQVWRHEIGGGDELVYEENIHGMWKIERYVNLLMGEIPRLSDDANGYGPNRNNYIAHVDIPENVKIAFEELKMVFGSEIRAANPLYATNMNKNS